MERKKKTVQAEKKSRAKHKCPDELDELIKEFDLFPPNFQMKSFTFVLLEQRDLLREQTGDSQAIPSIREALNVCLEGTPEEFRKHLESVGAKVAKSFPRSKQHMELVYNVNAMANEYCRIYDARMAMWMLVDRLERKRKGEITPEHWLAYPLTLSSTILCGEDGNLKSINLLGLIGKFDDSRLRRCEICNRIFWAKREESKTCSAPCFGILRTRLYRTLTDEEKAERKAQREANKLRNKKLKEIKEKINGNL